MKVSFVVKRWKGVFALYTEQIKLGIKDLSSYFLNLVMYKQNYLVQSSSLFILPVFYAWTLNTSILVGPGTCLNQTSPKKWKYFDIPKVTDSVSFCSVITINMAKKF